MHSCVHTNMTWTLGRTTVSPNKSAYKYTQFPQASSPACLDQRCHHSNPFQVAASTNKQFTITLYHLKCHYPCVWSRDVTRSCQVVSPNPWTTRTYPVYLSSCQAVRFQPVSQLACIFRSGSSGQFRTSETACIYLTPSGQFPTSETAWIYLTPSGQFPTSEAACVHPLHYARR